MLSVFFEYYFFTYKKPLEIIELKSCLFVFLFKKKAQNN